MIPSKCRIMLARTGSAMYYPHLYTNSVTTRRGLIHLNRRGSLGRSLIALVVQLSLKVKKLKLIYLFLIICFS